MLASCGKTLSQDSEYTCKRMIKDGETLAVSEYFTSPPILILSEGNTAKLEIDSKICDCTWENSSEGFALIAGNRVSCGTLKDGICTLDLFGQGVRYVFCSEIASLSDLEDEGMQKEKNNRWSGEWYGYWILQNASGVWENMDGQAFDCFARLDMGVDNTGRITIWDEKSSFSFPLSVVELKLAPSPSFYGSARSESGFFLSGDIETGEWRIEPDKEKLDNVLSFSSHYAGPDGAFDYMFLLRPWGYVWDDAIENETIRLPYYYNQWYLPMLSEKNSMPDSFEP